MVERRGGAGNLDRLGLLVVVACLFECSLSPSLFERDAAMTHEERVCEHVKRVAQRAEIDLYAIIY
jgi:hypothetical protein